MRSFRHRRGRIMFEIFGALLLGSLAAARWAETHSIFALVAALGLTGYAVFRMVMLFARNPALAFGDRGVQVGRLFRVSDFKWSDVRDIREAHWKRPYIPFMHWLPKERHYIELQFASETIRLRPEMMELPPDGAKQVIDGFRAAQVASLGERGAAMARLGGNPAQQASAPVSGVQAQRMQRLGLASMTPEDENGSSEKIAPSRQFNPPAYRGFGRKVS